MVYFYLNILMRFLYLKKNITINARFKIEKLWKN